MARVKWMVIVVAVLTLVTTSLSAGASTARILLKPRIGPPTTNVRVRGSGFGPSETVAITFDSGNVASATTDPNGSFSANFAVPAAALPGDHTVTATGQGGLQALATFLVRTDWSKFHFDPSNAGLNPYENVLNVSNVRALVTMWTGSNAYSDVATYQIAVANGAVYVGNLYGDLDVLDATGIRGCSGTPRRCTPLWTGHTSSPGTISSTPAVANGVVFVGSQNLYAFDAAGVANCSGTPKLCLPLWTGNMDEGAGLSSPAVVNGVVYVGSSFGTLYAFDAAGMTNCSGTPKSCQPLWTAPTRGFIESSPAVANGRVYVHAGNEPADGSLYAFDAAGTTNCSGTPKTCRLLWTAPTHNTGNSSPAVVSGVVYVGSTDGNLYAFDAAGVTNCSGTPTLCAPLWLGAVGSLIRRGPAVANGMVYVTGDKLYAFDATGVTNCSGTPEICQPLWSGSVGDVYWQDPAVANGVVYAISNTALYTFDAAGVVNCTGSPAICAPLWTAPNPDVAINLSPRWWSTGWCTWQATTWSTRSPCPDGGRPGPSAASDSALSPAPTPR